MLQITDYITDFFHVIFRIFRSRAVTPVIEKQLLLIDVFNSWTGPCIAAETYLKRLKHEIEGLVLARACCDSIEELFAFRGYVYVLNS